MDTLLIFYYITPASTLITHNPMVFVIGIWLRIKQSISIAVLRASWIWFSVYFLDTFRRNIFKRPVVLNHLLTRNGFLTINFFNSNRMCEMRFPVNASQHRCWLLLQIIQIPFHIFLQWFRPIFMIFVIHYDWWKNLNWIYVSCHWIYITVSTKAIKWCNGDLFSSPYSRLLASWCTSADFSNVIFSLLTK